MRTGHGLKMATLRNHPASAAHSVRYFNHNTGRTLDIYRFSRAKRVSRVPDHKTRKGNVLCTAAPVMMREIDDTYSWTGTDEFSHLSDRIDATPLPLPAIKEAKRVVLVRHGQSTWNAQGRIQGSSDISVLTEKGKAQAQTTQQVVGVTLLICTASFAYAL